jgi:hypothetical protein
MTGAGALAQCGTGQLYGRTVELHHGAANALSYRRVARARPGRVGRPAAIVLTNANQAYRR